MAEAPPPHRQLRGAAPTNSTYAQLQAWLRPLAGESDSARRRHLLEAPFGPYKAVRPNTGFHGVKHVDERSKLQLELFSWALGSYGCSRVELAVASDLAQQWFVARGLRSEVKDVGPQEPPKTRTFLNFPLDRWAAWDVAWAAKLTAAATAGHEASVAPLDCI